MTRMYDRPTLGPDGWIVDETPTPALLTWSLDSSGNPVGLYGPDGEVISGAAPAYTAVGRPAASSENAGTLIRLTNVGPIGFGSLWASDGVLWRPLNGCVLLAAAAGSVAAPVATYNGTGGQFTLPAGNPSVPGAVLQAGFSVSVEATVYRRNANATATLSCRLGTAGTTGDSAIVAVGMAATNALSYRVVAKAHIVSDTVYQADNWQPLQAVATSAQVDRTTNVNTAAAMLVTFDMGSANAGDYFDLLNYAIWIEG